MQISVSGKGVDVGATLQGHIENQIEEHVKKYFERPFGWQSFMALKRKFSRRKSA